MILEATSHIKSVSKKSSTADKILNHIPKTSASNIDLTFVNETIIILPKIKLMVISKLLWNLKTEI